MKCLYARTFLSGDLSKYSVPSSLIHTLEKFKVNIPTDFTKEKYRYIQDVLIIDENDTAFE